MDEVRLGASLQLARTISGTTLTASGVTLHVYQSDGTALAPITGTVEAGDGPNDQRIFANWTPDTVGNYTYLFRYALDGITQDAGGWGDAAVLPVTSKYDRYVLRTQRLLMETTGTDGGGLTYRAYMDALNLTAEAFSRSQPENARRVWQDVSLSSSLVYTLPDGAAESPAAPWQARFSRLLRVLYLPDGSTRAYLTAYQYDADDEQNTLRLLDLSPSTGQTLSLRYTAPHTLSHTQDTIPAYDFEAVCLYAAGSLLENELANQAAHTEETSQGAGLVSYRDQQQRRRQQGQDLMARGMALWRKDPEQSPFPRTTAVFGFGVASGRRGA